MPNYNTQLQSIGADLQAVLQSLQNKAIGSGGEQATPEISVNSSTGLITATAGSKTATYQMASQAAKTITPSKSSQTAVAKDVYTTGAVTVAAIPSQYITTTDATAAASEIFSGETAYVNGSKVTGTFTIDSELTDIEELLTELESTLKNKGAYNTIYVGTSVPTADFGLDGDIYIVRSGST